MLILLTCSTHVIKPYQTLPFTLLPLNAPTPSHAPTTTLQLPCYLTFAPTPLTYYYLTAPMFAAKKRTSAVDLLMSSFPAVQDTALRLSYKITLKPSLHIPITPEMRAAQVVYWISLLPLFLSLFVPYFLL